MRAIPGVLREFGVDPIPLLQPLGLSENTAFEDPDATLPLALVGSLLKNCVQATACPHFGLLVGRLTDASCLGAVGLLLASAPDVRTALESLVANLDLHDRGATSFLEISAESCVLGYEVYEHGIDATEQLGECAMAISWNILRSLCGPEWSPIEVRLRHESPVDVEPYREFFQAPLRFNAGHSGIVFATRWLDQPIPLVDQAMRETLLDRVETIRLQSNQNFRDRAHKTLVNLIREGPCSREQLAAHFSLHPRTLNRRLKEAGTSFRQLHAAVRREIARQLLRDTRRAIPAIASLLEYSDATAFNRAFSGWEGLSPAKWRKLVQATSVASTRIGADGE